jgi:hypothetical protein
MAACHYRDLGCVGVQISAKSVKVCGYKIWVDGEYAVSSYKATAEATAMFRGVPIPGTEETVDETLIDAQGKYKPQPV